jgi:prefoldin subunit 5
VIARGVVKTGAKELRKINKEIAGLKKTLTALQARNSEIEAAIGEARTEANAAANRAGE